MTDSTTSRTFADLRRRYPTARVRAWAIQNDLPVARTGGLPRFVYELYAGRAASEPAEHEGGSTVQQDRIQRDPRDGESLPL